MLNKLVVAIPATQTGKLVCESPKTQSIDAVKALLAFKKVACNPLPQEVSLDDGRLVLVLNNKKDAYYVVTPMGCSCPAATYHPGKPCKHSRKSPARNEKGDSGDIRRTLPGGDLNER